MSAPRAVGCARLLAGSMAGGMFGCALGFADWFLLARRIDFTRAHHFDGLTGEFVGYLVLALNGCGGLVGGTVALLPRRGSLIARALRGGVSGGYLGALLGIMDLLVLAHYLNLLDSDLSAIWRENRSLLVILNATAAAAFFAVASLFSPRL